jgi:phage/plasmid-like protein (TIGR03299 family)
MNLIDSILSETRGSSNGVVILSEQHDLGQIDWLAGLSDPGEMIACGYMPQARRLANESDDAYAQRLRTTLAPAQLEELKSAAMPAAIRRAGLDTSNGRVAVMVAGKTPWHKLGVNVAHAVDSHDAIRLAGLNWTVSKRPLRFDHNGVPQEQTYVYAMVRDDTGDCLGSVGSSYAPIQNHEGFSFFDGVLSEFGARYETAGAIHGGRKVWMLANLPQSSFKVGNGDEVETYAIFTNPHDGSGQAWCYPTTERVVCANTLRVSTGDRSKGIGIRHTGSIKAKIGAAKAALGLAVRSFAEFAEQADVLASSPIGNQAKPYFNRVLDGVLAVSAADAANGAEALILERKPDITPEDFAYAMTTTEKQIARRCEILDDIITRYNSERCNVNGIGGTAWAALQACTESADYMNGKRHVGTSEAQASRKFESVLAGDADEMKQQALVEALALTR